MNLNKNSLFVVVVGLLASCNLLGVDMRRDPKSVFRVEVNLNPPSFQGFQAATEGKLQFFNASNINMVIGTRGGWRPLMTAVRFNHVPLIEELLKNSSLEVEATDWAGWTALMHAAKAGKTAIVKVLLPKANVLAKDLNGKTPLIWGVLSGNLATVQEILNDSRMTPEAVNVKDKDPNTHVEKSALDYAKEKNNEAMINLLQSKGAK